MKDFTAYGIVVSGKLCAVYLDRYHANQNLQYYRVHGNATLVDLEVTKDSLEFINKALEEEQIKEVT